MYVSMFVAGLETISVMTDHQLDTIFFAQRLDMMEEIANQIAHVAAVLCALSASIRPTNTPVHAMIVPLVDSRIRLGLQSVSCAQKDSPATAALPRAFLVV